MKLFFTTVFALLISGRVAIADDGNFFERRVRPLLIKNCGRCHGGGKPKGRLTLTSIEGISRGGSKGAVVVGGKPDASRLIQAVRYATKLKMPPNKRLSATEIAILEKWVRAGAHFPRTQPVRNSASEFSDKDRQWWSFQPIRDPSLPRLKSQHQVRNGIDRFVLAKLQRLGLQLSSPADRRTLIRRVTFDLTGLPPTPAEVQSFLSDRRPDCYSRLIDGLLASPQYGVRWGRHWLDVARYADTNGGGFDYVYPNAWRYRDYVVRALNQDKPFDRFLLEQLAGDLLPPTDDPADADRLRATGFLTIAPKGLGMQDKEQMAMDVVDDQIDVIGRSVIGLTLACARCHDHKFDPIPTRDYYSLAGIFRSTVSVIDTDQNPSYWPEKPLESRFTQQARKKHKKQLAAAKKRRSETIRLGNLAVVAEARKKAAQYLFAAAKIYHSPAQFAPVAYWPFNDKQGKRVAAVHGPSGQLANMQANSKVVPKWATGKFLGGLQFAGKKEIVRIPPKALQFARFGRSTDFSVAFWMRTKAGYQPKTADTVISAVYKDSMWFVALRPGAYKGVYLRHYDGKRAVDIKPRTNQLARIVDSKWHHLVFTSHRNGNGIVYVDGRQVGSVPIAAISRAANYVSPKSFVIGASNNAFQGRLDDAAIWNRVLLPHEVRRLFDQGNKSGADLAAIERANARRAADSKTKHYDYAAAKRDGLVPSIVRRFVGLLREAKNKKDSPLKSLTNRSPMKLSQVGAVIRQAGQSLQRRLRDGKTTPFKPGDDARQFFGAKQQRTLKSVEHRIAFLTSQTAAAPEMGMVAFDGKKPSDLRIHISGERTNLGELARRGFPEILSSEKSRITAKQSGRLDLARWLIRPDHPLTARVFVNRAWQKFFGHGLVRTPDNFGRLGERPSHPRLLDWLAHRFVTDGWSIKQLHRSIVLSATYRQSSRFNVRANSVDTGNRLLWRMNRRRLQAEALRDALLSASDRIELRLNGTVNTWKHKMFSVDDANVETANYKTNRRSIYLPVVRGAAVHESLQLFDFGDPNSVTPQRDSTTVAPQALFLLNSPVVIQQAQGFADRLDRQKRLQTDGKIRLAYKIALARPPTKAEERRAKVFVSDGTRKSWELFCHSLFCLNEFIYLD